MSKTILEVFKNTTDRIKGKCEPITPLAVFTDAWEYQQQTIESLKAMQAQLEAELMKHKSDDYVLVPKVPSEAIKDQINEIIAESVFVETSWGGVNTAQFECGIDEVIYKAMIEAQEHQK